jgi:hypothetical protein
VRFCLVFPLLLLSVLVISAVQGAVKFEQVAVDIAFDALFALLFIAFYPRAAHPTDGTA